MATKSAKSKRGRPKSDERLEVVNFRADRAVREAIEKLTSAATADGVVAAGARSVAIRRALLAQAAQIGGAK